MDNKFTLVLADSTELPIVECGLTLHIVAVYSSLTKMFNALKKFTEANLSEVEVLKNGEHQLYFHDAKIVNEQTVFTEDGGLTVHYYLNGKIGLKDEPMVEEEVE